MLFAARWELTVVPPRLPFFRAPCGSITFLPFPVTEVSLANSSCRRQLSGPTRRRRLSRPLGVGPGTRPSCLALNIANEMAELLQPSGHEGVALVTGVSGSHRSLTVRLLILLIAGPTPHPYRHRPRTDSLCRSNMSDEVDTAHIIASKESV